MVPDALRPTVRRAVKEIRRIRGPRPPSRKPPAMEEGWVCGPPDFVGLGAQKAGTSWWYSLIVRHPAVHHRGTRTKEVHFFDRFFGTPFGDEQIREYHRHFPRPPGKLAGEWTPGYLSDFWMPPLLRRAAPDARLLVLLRDPIERYRSGLTHSAGLSREPLRRTDAIGGFVRGLYARQLEALWRHFPRDQVLVLQYERCLERPQEELARTFAFLRLDPLEIPVADFGRRVNETIIGKVKMPDAIRVALIEEYRQDVEHLARLVPELDLALWPNFSAHRG
jgi:hypothetical protein